MEYKTASQYYNKTTPAQKQQVQDDKQLYDKWYNFFANFTVISLWSDNAVKNIQIPKDTKEREVAQKAATDYINWANANYKTAVQQDKARGVDFAHQGGTLRYRIEVAKNFLRKCASYISQRDKQNTKDIKQLYSQGAGSHSQQDLIGNDTLVSKVDSAMSAATDATLYFKQGNQQALQDLTNQIKDKLTDPVYKTVFTYNYYKNTGRDTNNLQLKYDDIMRDYNEAKAGNSNMSNSLGFNNQNLAGRSYDYIQKLKQQGGK